MKRLFRRFFLYIRKFASDVPGSPAASLQRYRKTRLWLIGAALSRSDRLKTNTEAQKRSGPAAQRQFVKYEHRKCCGAERPSHYS